MEAAQQSEPILVEAEFRARQRLLLRAQVRVAVASVLGLALVFAAKEMAPGALDPAIAIFVIAVLGSLGLVWRTARRHWRCPACEVRWEANEALASLQWNHCATCGAELRVQPAQQEPERVAETEFAQAHLAPEELAVEVELRRRRGQWAAAVTALTGLAALAWIQEADPGELAEQGVIALFAGLIVGILVWSTRCPRCRRGLLAKGRHCQRCGFQLRDDLNDGAEPRTGT